jgi:hypothetical protein
MREEVHHFDNFIIGETCLLHRHLFTQQPCVMRKAGRSLVTSSREVRGVDGDDKKQKRPLKKSRRLQKVTDKSALLSR